MMEAGGFLIDRSESIFGYDVPRADEQRAGLVMFQHPTHSNEEVLEALPA